MKYMFVFFSKGHSQKLLLLESMYHDSSDYCCLVHGLSGGRMLSVLKNAFII
jgi:hypothetical protein